MGKRFHSQRREFLEHILTSFTKGEVESASQPSSQLHQPSDARRCRIQLLMINTTRMPSSHRSRVLERNFCPLSFESHWHRHARDCSLEDRTHVLTPGWFYDALRRHVCL